MGDKKNKKVLGKNAFNLKTYLDYFVMSDLTGLAWVNGMCKPTYSCTLNEGKSFEAAFVIAHEMGHR